MHARLYFDAKRYIIRACHATCKIEMLFLRGIISVYGLCDGLLCEYVNIIYKARFTGTAK